MTQSLSK